MSSLLSSSLHLPSSSNKPSPSPPAPSRITGTGAAPETFRQLVFQGSVGLQVILAPTGGATGSSSGGGGAVESYYIQAPRISYLPLLLPELKRNFLPLLEEGGTSSALKGKGRGSSAEDGQGHEEEEGWWFSTEEGVALKWHWPLGLLYDYHHSSPSTPASAPWRIHLHLSGAQTQAQEGQGLLQGGANSETCRAGFMNMLKEATHLRFGSTKRMTHLRKEQQDAIWEGVVRHDFHLFWSVFSRLVPPPPTSSSDAPQSQQEELRSIPLRVYLPLGAPVFQDLAPPFLPSGQPATLATFLHSSLPLFFPSSSSSSSADTKPLATPIVAGIPLPWETELSWLASCLTSADGWVGVVLRF